MNRFQRNAFLYSTVVAIGGFIFGLDAALISGTVNFITAEFNLTDWQLGTAVSAPGLGVLLALPLAGYSSNALGRKGTLQIIATLYLISAIGSALAPSYWFLVAARFLGGLAFSSITLASMYIGEIAPPAWRGKMVSMTQINIVVGLSAAYFVNYLILHATNSDAQWVTDLGITRYTWRWMLGTEVLPALIWFGMLMLIPRSPVWLLYKGRPEEANAAFARILPPEEVPTRIEEVRRSLDGGAHDESVGAQLGKIFAKPLRLTLLIGLTIAIVQQATGINAVLFYAPTIFEQLGVGTDAAFLQAIFIGLTSIVFTVLSILLIDRIGRRPLLIWGLLWVVVSLALCSFGFHQARYRLDAEDIARLQEIPERERLEPIAGIEYRSDTALKAALRETLGSEDARNFSGLLLQRAASMNTTLILLAILSFIAAFHFSVGPIMWVLFSEIFPAAIRGVAIPFFALATSIVNYLVQQFFPWQLANMGSASIFLFYAAMVTVGLIILYRVLPETKNMTIEEIEKSLQPAESIAIAPTG